MSNPFTAATAPSGPSAPSSDITVATPSDTVDLPLPSRCFYGTGTGNIAVITAAGETRVIPVGAFMPVLTVITRVLATGTTAGSIVVYQK